MKTKFISTLIKQNLKKKKQFQIQTNNLGLIQIIIIF